MRTGFQDVINSMAFSLFSGGPITIDHESVVKAYSASPSMLGRGHTLLEPQGPVWVRCFSCHSFHSMKKMFVKMASQSLDTSDYHSQLAVGSADGSCVTTNSLRSTRRGGSVVGLMASISDCDLFLMLRLSFVGSAVLYPQGISIRL
jgi:transcription factor C subunit 6